MKIVLPSICLFLSLTAANATISLSGPTGTGWVSLAGAGAAFDDVDDENTLSSNIVGDASNPGFLTAFDDGPTASATDDMIGFRVRFDKNGSSGPSISFDGNLWIGMDANLDNVVDLFILVNSGNLTISDSGTGLNTAPSNTTIGANAYTPTAVTASNYNYREVTGGDGLSTDLGTGAADTDYYLSVSVSFANIVTFLGTTAGGSITIDKNSHVQYLVGTSNNASNLNMDVGRVDDALVGTNDTRSWVTLGAFSSQVPASVPECSATLLTFVGSVLAFGFRRRR